MLLVCDKALVEIGSVGSSESKPHKSADRERPDLKWQSDVQRQMR